MNQMQPTITARPDETFDPVTLEILWSRLIGIADEMWSTVWQTSFSTIAAIVNDIGCEILDQDGGCLVHAARSMPAFNLTMPNVAREVLKRYPLETLRPGDAYICNDPWLVCGHLPDICLITPIFYQGRAVGFSGTISHAIDLGGTMINRKAREVFEEGVQIPLMKLYDQGRPNETFFEIIAANVREPTLVIGDLQAQYAANEVGAKRVIALLAEYGLSDIQTLSREIHSRTEQAMRAAIAAIPDGVYHGHVQFDALGTPLDMRAAVTVAGDSLLVDFAGTADELPSGAINSTLAYTTAHTTYSLMCLLTPHLPNNEGCTRPITITAPEGSILNTRYPSAVDTRSRVGWHCGPTVFDALAPAVPGNVMAACGLLQSFRARGMDDGYGQPFIVPCFAGGGQGAGLGRDGLPGYIYPSTASGMSVEVFESKAPAMIHTKTFLPDSGGAGQFRGGVGQRLVISRLPNVDVPVSIHLQPDRMVAPPPGVLSGKPGKPGRLVHNGEVPGPDSEFATDGVIRIRSDDDLIVYDVPGGGGYGDPLTRDLELIKQDLATGMVTPDGLRRDYGIDPERLDSAGHEAPEPEVGQHRPPT